MTAIFSRGGQCNSRQAKGFYSLFLNIHNCKVRTNALFINHFREDPIFVRDLKIFLGCKRAAAVSLYCARFRKIIKSEKNWVKFLYSRANRSPKSNGWGAGAIETAVESSCRLPPTETCIRNWVPSLPLRNSTSVRHCAVCRVLASESSFLWLTHNIMLGELVQEVEDWLSSMNLQLTSLWLKRISITNNFKNLTGEWWPYRIVLMPLFRVNDAFDFVLKYYLPRSNSEIAPHCSRPSSCLISFPPLSPHAVKNLTLAVQDCTRTFRRFQTQTHHWWVTRAMAWEFESCVATSIGWHLRFTYF